MTDDDTPKLKAIDGDGRNPADDSPPASDEVEAANDEAIRMKIAQLEEEHRDLDQAITTMEERMPYDRLTIQRLKKRKLALKDQITALHEEILPDIIA
ncbi:YdcH family protein [Parvularcula oceani]|uniref:YdcH family protein n=1 Tax=Parvularcula oceani TaxID=1247963 RepID=UPI000690972F|nr:YdcH family protein [Parvularcula oceani]